MSVHPFPSRGPKVRELDEVRAAWQETSPSLLNDGSGEWWGPPAEAVLESVLACQELDGPLRRFTAARRAQGVTLEDVLADLAALAATLDCGPRGHFDRLSTAHLAAAAWHDPGDDFGQEEQSCFDPLTGVMTSSFLGGRLWQAYRQCSHFGVDVAAAYALAVVQVIPDQDGGPLDLLARRMRLAHLLLEAFNRGETVALAGRSCFVVLGPAGEELIGHVADLRTLLAAEAGDQGRVALWIEPLPTRFSDAHRLLRDLHDVHP